MKLFDNFLNLLFSIFWEQWRFLTSINQSINAIGYKFVDKLAANYIDRDTLIRGVIRAIIYEGRRTPRRARLKRNFFRASARCEKQLKSSRNRHCASVSV